MLKKVILFIDKWIENYKKLDNEEKKDDWIPPYYPPDFFQKQIPETWFVLHAGQSLAHMLWYVHLAHKDDVLNQVENPRHIWVEEYDSYDAALKAALNELKERGYK